MATVVAVVSGAGGSPVEPLAAVDSERHWACDTAAVPDCPTVGLSRLDLRLELGDSLLERRLIVRAAAVMLHFGELIVQLSHLLLHRVDLLLVAGDHRAQIGILDSLATDLPAGHSPPAIKPR